MKKILFLCMALSLTACTPQTPVERQSTRDSRVQWISYHKDDRTDICFASSMSSNYGGSFYVFAPVPCTQKVLDIIEDPK
jgi:hypothetical protein